MRQGCRLDQAALGLCSRFVDFCNDGGRVRSFGMETNALRDEPAQKSASALVDAGDIAQDEMDGSSLRDRLLCTGLDCAYVFAR